MLSNVWRSRTGIVDIVCACLIKMCGILELVLISRTDSKDCESVKFLLFVLPFSALSTVELLSTVIWWFSLNVRVESNRKWNLSGPWERPD